MTPNPPRVPPTLDDRLAEIQRGMEKDGWHSDHHEAIHRARARITAKRIRALMPLESQGTLPAGNPNEAASGSTPADCLAPDKKPAGAKPQTGSSVAMQEAHNLFTLILGATYDVGMGDRTKEEALSECTKLAHDGMRVTSLPSQEAPDLIEALRDGEAEVLDAINHDFDKEHVKRLILWGQRAREVLRRVDNA